MVPEVMWSSLRLMVQERRLFMHEELGKVPPIGIAFHEKVDRNISENDVDAYDEPFGAHFHQVHLFAYSFVCLLCTCLFESLYGCFQLLDRRPVTRQASSHYTCIQPLYN